MTGTGYGNIVCKNHMTIFTVWMLQTIFCVVIMVWQEMIVDKNVNKHIRELRLRSLQTKTFRPPRGMTESIRGIFVDNNIDNNSSCGGRRYYLVKFLVMWLAIFM